VGEKVIFDEDGVSVEEILPDADTAQSQDAADIFEKKWKAACLKSAISHVFTQTALSDQSREIYRAYVLEDGDAGEVTRRFGVTPEVVRQVKSRVNRMIAALVKRFEKP